MSFSLWLAHCPHHRVPLVRLSLCSVAVVDVGGGRCRPLAVLEQHSIVRAREGEELTDIGGEQGAGAQVSAL